LFISICLLSGTVYITDTIVPSEGALLLHVGKAPPARMISTWRTVRVCISGNSNPHGFSHVGLIRKIRAPPQGFPDAPATY
jgi:hypothetical protein